MVESNDVDSRGLKTMLAAALPEGAQFSLYRISTPPTRCPAIYSVASGSKPERTYCESQFLMVGIRSDSETAARSSSGDQEGVKSGLLVYAIEVLIYTTASLTTLFVSKADSTGYLHLLKCPLGNPSPLKAISTAFLSHLVDTRRRPGVKLVVSLFARAQDQYLFPGSVENGVKHVLDDRGLVKWWCGVLDPVLRRPSAKLENTASSDGEGKDASAKTAKGYLVVPGFDRYETMPLLPSSTRTDPPSNKRWVNDHPLLQISSTPDAPPRCLIPHFPDDPKARYLDELDDEMTESYDAQIRGTGVNRKSLGQWRSVQSLDQFWEMMAFRQECSAGRIVGFIWIVFDPILIPITRGGDATTSPNTKGTSKRFAENIILSPRQPPAQDLPYVSRNPDSPHTGNHELSLTDSFSLSSSKSSTSNLTSPQSKTTKAKRKTRRPTGLIYTRQPRIKVSSSRSVTSSQPSHTPFYTWPIESRGEVVLDEKEYKRAIDLLLRLDFSNEALARGSTKRYVDEVGVIAGLEGRQKVWGEVVVGLKEVMGARGDRVTGIGVSSDGLARSNDVLGDAMPATTGSGRAPNVLGDGLVRKRPKISESEGSAANLLGSGLVRKKPKS
ncbi:hypothetical protein FGG08_003318 [Glutinoglossum americanum]|uniref:histone acetyltransferase n=1 Tax=Glutinoglossum americanum TaxID=1670608 RepID=A0A9P8IDJ0_9PEZI|nr:hypothetical protein FGG08_003318 [Glutinoglossum americanum]